VDLRVQWRALQTRRAIGISHGASTRTYRRFPGTGRYLLSRVKLYIGRTNLLQITATGYSEV
jgi:hypothetical protein